MFIFQPVSEEARRTFCPPRPIAKDNWSAGTVTVAIFSASFKSTEPTLAGAKRHADVFARVLGILDDVDLFAAQFRDDRLNARAALADTGTDRIDVRLGRGDRHFGSRTGLAGDVVDHDRAGRHFGNFQSEKFSDHFFGGARNNDLRPANRQGSPT